MKASVDAYELIKQFEGLRLKAYLCPAGIWTIGYGHTSGVSPNSFITIQEADEYLHRDVATIEMQLNKLNLILRQCQWDAIVSEHRLMAYEKSNGKLRLWIMEKLKAMMRTALYRRTFKKFTRTIMQQVQAAEELWEVDEELELLWNVVMDSEDKIGNNTERGMTTLAAPLLFGFVQTIFCKEKVKFYQPNILKLYYLKSKGLILFIRRIKITDILSFPPTLLADCTSFFDMLLPSLFAFRLMILLILFDDNSSYSPSEHIRK